MFNVAERGVHVGDTISPQCIFLAAERGVHVGEYLGALSTIRQQQ
jgi:hypothetical protein